MFNILKPYSWSSLYDSPTSEITGWQPIYKRYLLLSQLCIIAMIVTTGHLIWDLTIGHPLPIIMDMGIILVFFIGYKLNEKKYFVLAKGILLISLNIIFFLYANFIPKENGMYFLFFPLISFYFVIFDHTENLGKYGFTALSIGIFLYLEYHDYSFFGTEWIIEEPDYISYVMNFLSSIILIFFSYSFLVKTNFKAEKKLRSQADQILEQNKNLIKTNQELDLFVYRSSHDMKAPLSSVQGLIILLEREEMDPVHRDYISKIKYSVSKLEKLLVEISQYSRNMRLQVQVEPTDLQVLINEVIESHLYQKNADKIEVLVENEVKDIVLVDKVRLLTILSSLYYNAIKYHKYNQSNPYIYIKAWLESEQLFMKISDNGSGIKPGVKDKIFNMFYRGSEVSDGSGLGLFIVKEILEKMKGKIVVDSEPNQGSSFTFSIPIQLQKDVYNNIT